MSRFTSIPAIDPHPLLAATDPARVVWAVELLVLVVTALFAVYLGWVLARQFRIRFLRLSGVSHAPRGRADAWSESGRRLQPPPVDPEPHRRKPPDSRWQS